MHTSNKVTSFVEGYLFEVIGWHLHQSPMHSVTMQAEIEFVYAEVSPFPSSYLLE